jgi:AraC-like DNA-binding protein
VIRSASLTNYADVALKAGLEPQRMLREFALPPDCLHELELQVPLEAVRSLLEVSAERSGVEAFGLLMAEKRRLSNLGPLGLLMREQSTLRLAVEALARYANRLNDALLLTVEDAGEVVVLREELIVAGSGSIRQSTELAIGVCFRVLQTLLGPGWKARRVCFAHDAPEDRSVHDRVFGRIVDFGHDFNGIVLLGKDLDVANAHADPVLARYAQGLVEAGFSNKPADMAAQVRQLVFALIAKGTCTIDVIARHLGVTRRTVHRQLAADGLTFSEILEEVREGLAKRYMAEKHRSLAEISALLGFSAPSGFSRWHRRKFESAPSQRQRPAARRKR